MRLEFFGRNRDAARLSDAIFDLEKLAQACGQERHNFLPHKSLAADPHIRIFDGSHHLKPGFAQIGTTLVVNHTEGCARGMCGQHVADELIAGVAGKPWLFGIGAGFDFGMKCAGVVVCAIRRAVPIPV